MPKTLEEYVKEQQSGDVESAAKTISELLKRLDSEKFDAFMKILEGIKDSHERLIKTMESHGETLKKILERPDPVFPEPLPFPEPKEFPKFPEQLPYPEPKDLSPLLEELIERIGNEHTATRAVLTDLLNKEPDEVLAEGKDGKKMSLGGGVGSVRRRARWEIATFPRLNGTLEIKSAGDGITFYLPFSPIKNSETIRLNGGLPMSNGIDYTITGNQLLFVQDQTGSQIEMRAQN